MTICANTSVGFANLLSCGNTITEGLLGITILGGVWLLVYFRSRNSSSPRDALAAASFVGLLVAVMLRVLGALDDKYLGVALVLLAGTAAILAYNNRN